MLNRHAIVLYLGLAAVFALVRVEGTSFTGLGAALVVALLGLMVDDGLTPLRMALGHLSELVGAMLFFGVAATQLVSGASWMLPVAELGIGLAVLGVLLEMRLPYARLKLAAAVQALGDAVFLAALAGGFVQRQQHPNTLGWVFIGIAGGVAVYAAVVNLGLQLARLRDPGAGWRYRVLDASANGLKLKTLQGEATVEWKHVQGIRALDARRLLLVLPSPLPDELSKAQLPVEELRESDAPVAPDAGAPAKYALILHEQELGSSVDAAQNRLQPFVPATP